MVRCAVVATVGVLLIYTSVYTNTCTDAVNPNSSFSVALLYIPVCVHAKVYKCPSCVCVRFINNVPFGLSKSIKYYNCVAKGNKAYSIYE